MKRKTIKSIYENIQCDVDIAQESSACGDAWPEIILAFKAEPTDPKTGVILTNPKTGIPIFAEKFAAMVRTQGVAPNSEAANFIASYIDGSFKRTKHDKAVYREYETHATFRHYAFLLERITENPNGPEAMSLRGDDANIKTEEDIYKRIASELGKTVDAVKKQIARSKSPKP